MKAKAIQFLGDTTLQLVDHNVAKPKPNEVLIETKACGICTFDTRSYVGDVRWTSGILRILESYGRTDISGTELYPAIVGHEPAGVVVEVGDAVTHVKPGDKVTSLGSESFATYFKSTGDVVAKLPNDVTQFEYWISEPCYCVINALRNIVVEPADNVVLIGCGFMGALVLQALQHTLAENIVVVDVVDRALNLAESLGAHITINSKKVNVVDAVIEQTGRYADIVIEAAGVPSAIADSTNLTRKGGKIALFAHHSPGDLKDTNVADWHMKGLSILNTTFAMSKNRTKDFQDAVRLMKKGVFNLKPLISHKHTIFDAEEAMNLSLHRPDNYIKGVFIF